MNRKIIILLVVFIPITLIAFWLYMLLDVSTKTDINGSTKQNNTTGSISSGDVSDISNNQSGDTNTKVQVINLYMPDVFVNKGFDLLKSSLLKNSKVSIRIKSFKNMKQYRDELVTKLSGDQVDIFMVPTYWIDTFGPQSQKLDFNQNISILFNFLFDEYINDANYTYIPFAVDPLITIINNNLKINRSKITISDIKEASMVSSSGALSKHKFPLLFGVGKYDMALLKGNQESFNNYFIYLYALINQAFLTKDPDMLKSIISTTDTDFSTWDYVQYNKLVKKFSETNKNCENFPNVCILLNGFADSSFALMSDADSISKYFPQSKKNISDFSYYNFIGDSNIYPVVGRGFLVNKNTKKLPAVQEFIKEYIKQGTSGNTFFWDNTFSAFNNVFDKQRTDQRYDKILPNLNKFTMIRGGVDLQSNFIKNTKLLDVLRGNYSVGAFLDNIDWKF